MIEAYDFTSSYPYCLLAFKYPMERFCQLKTSPTKEEIIKTSDRYAYIFRLEVLDLELKDLHEGMPFFQFSKCDKINDEILDNGRVLQCSYVSIYITEQDLILIDRMYNFSAYKITQCFTAKKDYLPRYLTDYIYELFKQKTQEKGGDPILYALLKAKLNSVYGMLVQKWIKEQIIERYDTGEYETDKCVDKQEIFNNFIKKQNNIFVYQWGIYCTAYAVRNLYTLGSMCRIWLYSDTDSCYGIDWDKDKIQAYNQKCIVLLKSRGYDPIKKDGKTYALGTAELDGQYIEFKMLGAKRYCTRNLDGKLKITVAGVPKKGVASLNNDMNNFKKGLVFSGKISGKKQHTYLYVDEIYIDEKGNEVGDSIDLTDCDYLLDAIECNLLDTWDEELEYMNITGIEV